MGKLIFQVVLITLTLSACRPCKEVRDRFQYTKFCYDGNYNGIDTLIAINGYYEMYKPYSYYGYKDRSYQIDSSIIIKDTVRNYSIFFNDGFFIHTIDTDFNNGPWGKYIIEGDLIKGQYIGPPGDVSWTNTEIWFQIKDYQTIEMLYFKHRNKITDQEVKEYQEKGTKSGYTYAKFIPLDTLQYPDKSWLKNQKWFWCNEEDYEEYMKQKNKK